MAIGVGVLTLKVLGAEMEGCGLPLGVSRGSNISILTFLMGGSI